MLRMPRSIRRLLHYERQSSDSSLSQKMPSRGTPRNVQSTDDFLLESPFAANSLVDWTESHLS